MPTPFTHLAIAQRLLKEEGIPADFRALLTAECSAFLLGSVAADARVSGSMGREVTHFYSYDEPIRKHPWRVMLGQHPSLQQSNDAPHRAFLAGYVAHLATDEAWAVKFMHPQFVVKEWNQPRPVRFYALHLLLIHMDERDLNSLETWQPETLLAAEPYSWLPFLPDEPLSDWRDYIGKQIGEEGASETIAILASRLSLKAEHLERAVHSAQEMDVALWQHVSQETLAAAEQVVYEFTCEQLCVYLKEFG